MLQVDDTSIACQRAGRSPPSPACSGSGRPWVQHDGIIMWTFCEDRPIEKLKEQSFLYEFMHVIHVQTIHFEEISPFSAESVRLLSNGFDVPMWERKHCDCKQLNLHPYKLDVQFSHLLLRDIHQASQDLAAAISVSLLGEVPNAFFVQVQRRSSSM